MKHTHVRGTVRRFRQTLIAACSACIGFFGGCSPARGEPPAAEAQASAPVLDLRTDGAYTLGDLASLLKDRASVNIVVGQAYQKRTLFISAGHYSAPNLLSAVEAATGLVVRDVGGVKFLTSPNAQQMGEGRLPILPAPLLARLNKDLEPLGKNADLKEEGVPFPNELFLDGKSVPYKDLSVAQQEYITKLTKLHNWGGQPGWLEGDPRLPAERDRKLAASTIRFGTSYLMGFDVYAPRPQPSITGPSRPLPDAGRWWILQVAYDYRQDLIRFPARGAD
jgi:hypothetical protein